MILECQNCKCAILEGIYCSSCAGFMIPQETPKPAVEQEVETVKKVVKKRK